MRLIPCAYSGCDREPAWRLDHADGERSFACDSHVESLRTSWSGYVRAERLLDRIPDWLPGEPLYPDADLRDEERRRVAIADDLDGFATAGAP